ncbi:hypothetical protein BDW66DRAFT_31163 [Aspergillus desertorum]
MIPLCVLSAFGFHLYSILKMYIFFPTTKLDLLVDIVVVPLFFFYLFKPRLSPAVALSDLR